MQITQSKTGAGGIVPIPIEPVSALTRTLQVTGWEWKHFLSNRSSWMIGGAAFCFFTGLLAVRNQWGAVLGTTALGQLAELVYDLMLIFGVMLPFLVTDQVAHDYQERMHELLMTTAIPTSIYVLGRYLAAVLISFCLGLALLAAQLLVNLALPFIYPIYPAVNALTTLSLWARLTLPAGLLAGSLCFCLGTLFPRVTAVPKIATSLAWVILALDNDPTDLTWRAYWNPTGAGMITLAYKHFQDLAEAGLKTALNPAGGSELILHLQQNLPDLQPWLAPFLALAGIGLLLGLLTVAGFRRFRSSMNA